MRTIKKSILILTSLLIVIVCLVSCGYGEYSRNITEDIIIESPNKHDVYLMTTSRKITRDNEKVVEFAVTDETVFAKLTEISENQSSTEDSTNYYYAAVDRETNDVEYCDTYDDLCKEYPNAKDAKWKESIEMAVSWVDGVFETLLIAGVVFLIVKAVRSVFSKKENKK